MAIPCPRWFPALLITVLIAGCQDRPAATTGKLPETADHEAEIRASLAQLAPEDQKLAEQQKYCPVMTDVRLGETGKPYKMELQGQTIFLCCKSCVRDAEAEPQKTLAALKDLKARPSNPSGK